MVYRAPLIAMKLTAERKVHRKRVLFQSPECSHLPACSALERRWGRCGARPPLAMRCCAYVPAFLELIASFTHTPFWHHQHHNHTRPYRFLDHAQYQGNRRDHYRRRRHHLLDRLSWAGAFSGAPPAFRRRSHPPSAMAAASRWHRVRLGLLFFAVSCVFPFS
jgi:hypothetical protein